MTDYGVKRLAAINSGNYLYADVDLSMPVHLAAPNNRGKSTLVNALQFLYIDDFSKMRFGLRSQDDTRRHYFGEDRSYLVFECLTPSGIQCMLVRGLSNLRGGHFERYVYDGPYEKADYIADGDILDFDALRVRLADRHLAKVKRSELWHVLSGKLPSGDGKTIPRLRILPIRRRDEYTAFRNVFVRLLSLQNADAQTLRQLIIESHAREVGEKKVDVAAEYKAEFDRAERSESELAFISAVAADIDQGIQLRSETQILTERLTKSVPAVFGDAARCRELIAAENKRLVEESERLAGEQQEFQTERDDLLRESGTLNERLNSVELEWEELQKTHRRWSAYSPEFIEQMRQNAKQQETNIAELERLLDQAGSFDLEALRRHVLRLIRQTDTDRRAIEQWELTAAVQLRESGLSEAELDAAFRVANPDLLKLIVGDTLRIREMSAVMERIRGLARRVKDGTYRDDAVEADVSNVAGPELQFARDPEELRKGLTLSEQELASQQSRLAVAEDAASTREMLDRLKREHEPLANELREYEDYLTAWADRANTEKQLTTARNALAEVEEKVSELEGQLKASGKRISELTEEQTVLTGLETTLSRTEGDIRREMQRLYLDELLNEDAGGGQVAEPKSLVRFAGSVTKRLQAISSDTSHIEDSFTQLKQVQDRIAATSSTFAMQRRYFSDEDEEWRQLSELHESLPRLEVAAKKNWDALFTTLGARLNGIVTAVRNIKIAVERINRSLKSYRVSNLRAVDIRVEEVHGTYAAIESLADAEGLFQNRDEVDLAKKRLRQMIDTNEMIELESLFELRIQIQETDGQWHQAASLDEIGSTGTGMTAKAMIFIQLIRAIAEDEKYRLHFYIDGLGELDDRNLDATAAMAVSKGFIPITADPRLHLEPLAQPEVTVYSLGQGPDGRFCIDSYKTYRARRLSRPAGVSSE